MEEQAEEAGPMEFLTEDSRRILRALRVHPRQAGLERLVRERILNFSLRLQPLNMFNGELGGLAPGLLDDLRPEKITKDEVTLLVKLLDGFCRCGVERRVHGLLSIRSGGTRGRGGAGVVHRFRSDRIAGTVRANSCRRIGNSSPYSQQDNTSWT